MEEFYRRNFFWRNLLGGFFGRISWEDFLEGFFWEEFFVYIGIDLFVNIFISVKILSQWRRKEEGGGQEFRSFEVQETSSLHLNDF